MKLKTLLDQIQECINNRNWTAPKTQRTADHYVVGQMSDEMKTLNTLFEQKCDQYNEKATAYETLRVQHKPHESYEGTRMMFFGPMSTMFVAKRQLRSAPWIRACIPTTQLDSMYAELPILMAEIQLLQNLLHIAAYDVVEPSLFNGGDHIDFLSDYSIAACLRAKDYKERAENHLTTAMTELMEICHVVQIPKGNDLYTQFTGYMDELKQNFVVAAIGEIPNLSNNTTATLFFPKDTNDRSFYRDPRKDDNATTLKQKGEDLFTAIQAVGTPYAKGNAETAKEQQV